MWLTEEYVKATIQMREDEVRQVRLVSEARKQAGQHNRNGGAWRWRVEPGMEEAFQDLLGWLLPGQRDAEMGAANSPPQPSPSTEGEGRTVSEPEPLPI